MTDDTILRRSQAALAAAKPKPEARVLDAADRKEATNSADARKARAVVRELRSGALAPIAAGIAKITSDLKLKHGLEEAVERFLVANARYRREELLDVNQIMGWPGPGNGILPTLPPECPEHKIELADAWNLMLRLVNEATKVGVHKPHREHPIMLMIDIEQPELNPSLILPGSIDWN